MSKPWPDEVRQMVDALMHGGACPSVYGCSEGGHRIHTGRAWADYDERGRWCFDGSVRNAAFVLAELLQRSDTTAPAQTLAARILVAVPTARTQTTDDGIEVSVGSKSVRWKREKRGWSRDDDLGTGSYAGSDERVIEHAKQMAVEQAPRPLLERLREAVPGLEWSADDHEIRGRNSAGYSVVYLWRKLLCYVRENEPHAVNIERPSDDECVRIVKDWYAKTHPKAESVTAGLIKELVRKLGAEGLLPQTRSCGQSVFVSVVDAGGVVHECELRDGGWYFGETKLTSTAEVYRALLEAATPSKPVAPQPSPRALDTATQATARDVAWREMVLAILRAGLPYDSYGDYLEVLATSSSCWRIGITSDGHWQITSDERLPTAEAAAKVIAWAKSKQAAEQRERTVTITTSILDTEALTRAIEEQSRREKAHAAKGTTMTTQTKALDQAKMDASEAALRTAAKQLAKAARDPLAGAVARHLAPGDDSMRAKVAALLETEAGLAMLKAVLSLALGAIPQAGTRGAALAHELRVQAMSDGADLALDVIAGPLREVVALYLQDPAGAPAAAPALDEPQHAPASVDWSKAREVLR